MIDDKKVSKQLMKDLGLKNIYSVPRVVKVVVSMGIGSLKDDKGFLESAASDLSEITGQKPSIRVAKKSIAGFKLREGEAVGLMVTLRGQRMHSFLYKLFNIVLPRVRDFRGLKRSSFDSRGNYSFGLNDHSVFPEIDPNSIDRVKNLGITISTTAKNDDEGFKLLEKLGLPFKEDKTKKNG